jgi:DNA end-binding protein Ku
VLHTLYYADELHKANRSEAPKAKYSTKELELARNLVNHLKAPFRPQEFRDTYRENLQQLIRQKQKGQKVTAIKQPGKAPVIDLMEALKRRLKDSGHVADAVKQAPRKTTAKKVTRRKAALRDSSISARAQTSASDAHPQFRSMIRAYRTPRTRAKP